MSLRPYQAAAIGALRAAFAMGVKRVCLQLPTGAGKTYLCAHGMIAPAIRRGRKVIFVAHLDALIGDTAKRLRADGIECGVVQADRERANDAPVQVCSIQTLSRRELRPPADLVVIDECHRVMCDSYLTMLDGYPDAHVVGLTATPQRGDGAPLGDVFQALVQGPSTRELIDDGTLAEPRIFAPPKPNSGVADPARFIPFGGRSLVFASSVAEAEDIRSRHPRKLGVITAETPYDQREQFREDLRAGRSDGIVGVNVFLEGFDEPTVTRLVFARQFGVVGAYLQAIGRGLRKAPGKDHVDVYDLAGNVFLHGLPDETRTWSLDGEAVARKAPVASVRRCEACLAVFPGGVAECPRCGAKPEPKELPVYMNRTEKLTRIESVPEHIRDRAYLRKLVGVAMSRMRMPEGPARVWALKKFRTQFKREPYSST